MTGFFLNLAQLARGEGPRVEPRLGPVWDESSIEPMPEPNMAPWAPSGDVPILPPVASGAVVNEIHRHESQSFRDQVVTERETLESNRVETLREERRTEIDHEVRSVHERTNTVERERQETIRELLREARLVHERRTTESTFASEVVSHLQERTLERQRETERLTHEIRESRPTRAEAGAPVPVASPTAPEAPTVEVHIGRIEIRAVPGEGNSAAKPKARPSGIIALDEYLRDRSRGDA